MYQTRNLDDVGLKIDPIWMYPFSTVNPSLSLTEKCGHIFEQKHIECEKMYNMNILIVYFPLKWWAIKKNHLIKREIFY